MEKRGLTVGRGHVGMAAALCVVGVLEGEYRGQREIVEAVMVIGATVRKGYEISDLF